MNNGFSGEFFISASACSSDIQLISCAESETEKMKMVNIANFFMLKFNQLALSKDYKITIYLIPCINFFKVPFNNNAIIPITKGTTVKIKKKVVKLYSSVTLSI